MKQEADSPSKKLLIVYRSIVVLLLVLLVIIIGGSLYALIRPTGSGPLFRIGTSESAAMGNDNSLTTSETTGEFSGIGRLRIPLAVEAGSEDAFAAVILSISFPYPANDRSFTEELNSRIGEFRSIAEEYFTSLPPEKILELDEEIAKREILKSYNELLRLGKIETLYFSDFMPIK
jgi:flagellar basal body-associated protein FliL